MKGPSALAGLAVSGLWGLWGRSASCFSHANLTHTPHHRVCGWADAHTLITVVNSGMLSIAISIGLAVSALTYDREAAERMSKRAKAAAAATIAVTLRRQPPPLSAR